MINLTTLPAVKTLLELTDTDFDTILTDLIADVSLRVQSVYDVDLERQSYTEQHAGGGKRIYVRNPPVFSVTTIYASEVFDFTAGELIPASDYAIVNQGWDIAHISCWPAGKDGLEVTYLGGYLDASDMATTLPSYLQKAVARQVAFEFQNRKHIGLTNVDYPDGTITKENRPFLRSIEPVFNSLRKFKIG